MVSFKSKHAPALARGFWFLKNLLSFRVFLIIRVRYAMAYEYVGAGYPSCYDDCKTDGDYSHSSVA